MSRLIRRIRYVVMIVLFLLSARYALNLRQHYQTILNGFSQVHGGAAVLKPVTSPKPQLMRKEPMAAAFRSGHLPNPLPIPSGDPDQVAADLAKKIVARDEQSTAALLTALQMAGFSIRGTDGTDSSPSISGTQGLAFQAWQVAAMSKLYGEGNEVAFDALCKNLAAALPGFKGVPLGKLVLQDIAADAQGSNAPLRFWARLIVELGKQSGRAPYDMLSGSVEPNRVHLDPIQFSLIALRLGGDLAALGKSSQKRVGPASLHRQPNRPLLLMTVYHPDADLGLRLVDDAPPPAGANLPCTMTETEQAILDFAAMGSTLGYGQLAAYLKTLKIDGLSEYTEGVGKFNALLTLLRFYWIKSAMHADIGMKDAPLERTKSNTQPGQRRDLSVHLTIDMGKWQTLNCFRLLTLGANVDLGNLPNNGNVEGADVAWRLPEGGGDWIGDLGGAFQGVANPSQIVGIPADKLQSLTGHDGIAVSAVEGAPQQRDLSNVKVREVMKEFQVAVEVKLKNTEESNRTGDLADFLNMLTQAVTQDSGGPVTWATELIYRCHCFVSPPATFQLKDWVANGAWTGTITYTHTYDPSFPPNIINDSRVKSTTTSTEKIDTESLVTLDGTLTNDGLSQSATLSGSSVHTGTTDSHAEAIDDCHRASNIVTYTEDSHGGYSDELTGKSTYRAIVSVSIFTPPNGPAHYTVSSSLTPGEDFSNNGTHKQWWTMTRSGCGESKTDKYSPPDQTMTIGLPIPDLEGDLDPNHPDVIKGQKETSGRDGEKVSITWALVRH